MIYVVLMIVLNGILKPCFSAPVELIITVNVFSGLAAWFAYREGMREGPST